MNPIMDTLNKLGAGVEQGIISDQELEALTKTLSAGMGYAGLGTNNLTQGGVLQTESLDSTMKSVTFEQKALAFWPNVPVGKANALYEQYNRFLAYGGDSSPFISEGGAPIEEESHYVRDGQRIGFFGEKRSVTHQATMINLTIGDAIAFETKNGTINLTKKLERNLYWGHAHFSDSNGNQTGSIADLPPDSIAINGLLQQLLKGESDSQHRSGDFEGYGERNSIVKNLAGTAFSQDSLEDGTVIVSENFGEANQLHMEPKCLSAFTKSFYPIVRSEPGLANQTVGYSVNKVTTTLGQIDLKTSTFLRPKTYAQPASNASCPSIAGLSIAGVAAGVGGVIPQGNYHYALTLTNDYGESSPIYTTSAVPVSTGNKVTITVTGSLPPRVKYMTLYRTNAGGSASAAAYISNHKIGIPIVDAGVKAPGLSEAFMIEMQSRNMEFRQLMPLSRFSLAVVTTAYQWFMLLYGGLFVYTPRFNYLYTNVGK